MANNGYRIDLKIGYILTDDAGNIIEDHSDGRHYTRAADPSWRIVGIGKRAHSQCLVTLPAAAYGADIGHGWIHDCDHGTRRMWVGPRSKRAIRVTRL